MTQDEKERAAELARQMIIFADNIDKWEFEVTKLKTDISVAEQGLHEVRRQFDALLYGEDED
jgi:hypothetical protein